MNFHIRKIGLAIAFSPTAEAMLAEAARLASLFEAELVLIHIGDSGEAEKKKMEELVQLVATSLKRIKIRWEKGEPVKKILEIARHEKIDVLVAGALKKENLLKYYVGTIARKILRRAECSVWLINNPGINYKPIHNIVVNAEDSPFVKEALEAACLVSKLENASWIHVVRELKMLGLALAANEQCTEDEYNESRQQLMKEEITQVEKILDHIPHDKLKINIKMLSGKSGFELARFAEKKNADLLIVGAPREKFSFFDRVFPHDLEYIFADLPCNLLVVHPGKEETHG